MPVTTNRSFCIPNTGDLPAAWGTSAINPNFQYLDALIGGTTVIALSSATTITLTVPPTTGTSSGSASQSQVAMIKFTGAQTGNAVIKFSLPGYYIIDNRCTGTSYVQLAPNAAGSTIGAPPGQKIHVFYDGTDMDYVNQPTPGTALDLNTNTTSLPPWMQACSTKPYLLKDGSVYSASLYPALAQLLGSTYGGDGSTTFGVPDERARMRIGVDVGGATMRVTAATSGINAAAFNAAGGDQSLTAHGHTVTDNHRHYIESSDSGYPSLFAGTGTTTVGAGPDWGSVPYGSQASLAIYATSTTSFGAITVSSAGAGASQNMPPSIVSNLPLVKT